MRLSAKEKLLARLCLKIQPSQVERLLSVTDIPTGVRQRITSPIKFLVCLKKRSKNFQEFLSKLEDYVEVLHDGHAIKELLERFHKAIPDLSKLDAEPAHRVSLFTASEEQSHSFKRALIKIGMELDQEHLEILVALSPIPEGTKELLTSAVKWFDKLKSCGYISEDDTELLEDLFRVLKLGQPSKILEEYSSAYPPVSPGPSPSAPPLEHLPSFASIIPSNQPQLLQAHLQSSQLYQESSPPAVHQSRPVISERFSSAITSIKQPSQQVRSPGRNYEPAFEASISSSNAPTRSILRPVLAEDESSPSPAPKDPQPFIELRDQESSSLPMEPNMAQQPQQVMPGSGKKSTNKDLKKVASVPRYSLQMESKPISFVEHFATGAATPFPVANHNAQEANDMPPLPQAAPSTNESLQQLSTGSTVPSYAGPDDFGINPQPEVNAVQEANNLPPLAQATASANESLQQLGSVSTAESYTGLEVGIEPQPEVNADVQEANNLSPPNATPSTVESYKQLGSNEMFPPPVEGQSAGSRYDIVPGVEASKSPQELAKRESSRAKARPSKEQSSTVPASEVCAMLGGNQRIPPPRPSPVLSRNRIDKRYNDPPASVNERVKEEDQFPQESSYAQPGVRESPRIRRKRRLQVDEEVEAKRPKQAEEQGFMGKLGKMVGNAVSFWRR